jgi:MFS family permease
MLGTARSGLRRYQAPLQVADVRRVWLSDILSVLGDHAAILALAVFVYERSHSVIAVALTSAAAFAPAFGPGPLLATLADRFCYRSVMLTCDLIRASAYALILLPGLPVPVMVGVVFAAHCTTFPFTAARGALLPEIAGDHYGAAQGLSQSTLQVGALLGYAIGGGLLTIVGARGALVSDVASFLVSALLILRLSSRARTTSNGLERQPSAFARLASGARTLRRDQLLFWPAVLVTIAVLGATAADAMAVIVVRTLAPSHTAHGGALLALLLILPVVVTLIATLVCPTEGDPRRLIRLSGWMAIGSHSIAATSLVFLHHGAAGIAAAAIAYASLGVSSAMTVPCVSVVGRRLPANNRASVFSLLEASLVGGQAAGALLAGWSVTTLGAGHGIALLLVPAILVSAVGLSRLRSPATATATATGPLPGVAPWADGVRVGAE